MYLENITMRKDWRELAALAGIALAGIALAAQKVQLCTPSVFFDRKEEMPKPTPVEKMSITRGKGSGKAVESMSTISGKVNYKKA